MWVIFALLTSIINALYYIFNQNSHLSPALFMIYRGYFLGIIGLPLLFLYAHTFPWQFYFIAFLQGLTVSYTDFKYFQAFHKFGAENVTAITPLTVMITFFIWLMFKPTLIFEYLEAPLQSLFIFLSISAIVFSVIKYHNEPLGLDCLKFMAMILIFSSLINISNKIIMQYAEGFLLTATLHRVAITGLIIGTTNLIYHKQNTTLSEIINPKNLKQGLFILWLALSMICINFSMHYAKHPAYTSAIIYLSVVWIMLFNKYLLWRGYKVKYKKIATKWIMTLLLAAITLSILTN